jgi:RimJ/RimL family protein N-acetyltransferase
MGVVLRKDVGLQTTIREYIPADGEKIFALRKDPRLRGMQYAPSILETPKSQTALFQPGPDIPKNGWKCSCILVDGDFAGHISQGYSTRGVSETTVLLGWNIVPELWGRKIVVRALELLITARFESQPSLVFIACCFASNARCLRVIQKLGFRIDRLTVMERLSHYMMTWGREHVVKYRLDFDLWQNRNIQNVAEQ